MATPTCTELMEIPQLFIGESKAVPQLAPFVPAARMQIGDQAMALAVIIIACIHLNKF